ncbi:hypothetical protein Ddc_00094 [Ditylenchus destructor]|nr:hypothetical protein Ddc_00094 [Ditylenchus destructor]
MELLDISFDDALADASELMDISALNLSSSFSQIPDFDVILQNLSVKTVPKPTMRSKSVLNICTPTTLVIRDKQRPNVTDKILDADLGNNSLRSKCARKSKPRKRFTISERVQLKHCVTSVSPAVISKISRCICTPTTLVIRDKQRPNVTDKVLDVVLGNNSLQSKCARKPKLRNRFTISERVQLKHCVTTVSPAVIGKISRCIWTAKDLENVEVELYVPPRKTPTIEEISNKLSSIRGKQNKMAAANMELNVLFSEPWQHTFNTESIRRLQINDQILCADSNTGIFYEAKIIDIEDLDHIGRFYWVHYVRWTSKWDVRISADNALQRFRPCSEENKRYEKKSGNDC